MEAFKEIIGLIILYLGNVFVFATPWAVLEIWLETFKGGWAGEFRSPFWGNTVRKNFILTYVTVYHLVAVSVLVGLLVFEFFVLRYVAGKGFWVLDIPGIDVRIVPAMFLPAVLIGIMAVEDFLWFALNWRYKDALKRLLRGDAPWHLGWFNLTKSVKLPRMYQWLIVAVVLLVAQSILARAV